MDVDRTQAMILAGAGGPSPLVVRGHANSYTGYGQHTAALAKQVERLGIPVRFEAIDRDASIMAPDPWVERRILGSPASGRKLQSTTPRTPVAPGDVILTMWETTRIDPGMARNLNRAGGVIVPCRDVEGWFRASGVEVPIAVVPLGYDHECFIPGAPNPGDTVRFGCAGRTAHGGLRKGIDEVIDAFLEAFPADPRVELRVKCWSDCTVKATSDPRIVVNRESLSIESLADWYRSLDVFVSASRGEGFGLQPLQAMACGVPHLAPVWGGHRAYMTPETGWPVDFREEPATGETYAGCGHWCVPRRGSLARLMREIADDPQARRQKGDRAAIRALEFTWDAAGPRLVEALRTFGLIGETPRPTRAARPPDAIKAGLTETPGGRHGGRAMKALAMTIYNRPDYLRRTLDSLSRCVGIGDYTLLPHVEPGNDEVRSIVEGVDFCECIPTWNRERLGVGRNIEAAIADGFGRSSYSIYSEEDIEFARDALLFYEWAGERYKDDPKVSTVTPYNRQYAPVPGEWHHRARRRPWFHGITFATWRDRFAIFDGKIGETFGWDGLLQNLFLDRGMEEVYPVLGRVDHIGLVTSAHADPTYSPEWYLANSCSPFWAANHDVGPGEFEE